jgi:anti-anti-sigma factor
MHTRAGGRENVREGTFAPAYTARVTGLGVELGELAGRPAIAIRGELDISGVEELERSLAELESEQPQVLVIDLRGVTFLDSSGLRALLAADRRARRAGRRLALVRGPEPVQRVFEIALLDRRLTFVDPPEAAPLAGA